ncbi:hypothetical protein ACE2AJ_14765 [Aquihabitans daechungensis]|uniref:hypothetical protein n=1 Tax=Aquihabitans daechungensis TaxID=1052257 RepID=UPI003B9FBB16
MGQQPGSPSITIDRISEAITSAPVATTSSPTAASDAGGRRDWQRISLFTGGILFAIGNLLHPLEHSEAAYHAATWKAAHLTIFFSIPFLVLGLPSLHRKLMARVPSKLATIAVASSVAGLIGIAPGCIIEAFVAPMIGHEAMTSLESGGMGVVNAVLGVAYLGGTITLGWAVRRAELRPRGAGTSLIASAVVLLGVMGATGPAAGVVVISATVVYGGALAALAAKA